MKHKHTFKAYSVTKRKSKSEHNHWDNIERAALKHPKALLKPLIPSLKTPG